MFEIPPARRLRLEWRQKSIVAHAGRRSGIILPRRFCDPALMLAVTGSSAADMRARRYAPRASLEKCAPCAHSEGEPHRSLLIGRRSVGVSLRVDLGADV
jgi:hypothetical protein